MLIRELIVSSDVICSVTSWQYLLDYLASLQLATAHLPTSEPQPGDPH